MPHQSLGSSSAQTPQQIVWKYFDLITKKDVEGLLELFTENDPVVYEPFSKEEYGLRGKDSIKSFLKVAVMANEGLKWRIRIVKDASDRDGETVTAFVSFERGDTMHGRFTFSFVTEKRPAPAKDGKSDHVKKIKSLRIHFM